MFHSHDDRILNPDEFAALGTDAVAYMRKISAKEMASAFPDAVELDSDRDYWALFAADGVPIMLADQASDIEASAFYNEITAILPN